jgi:hypothetical protein
VTVANLSDTSFTIDLLEALDKGLEVEHYLSARAAELSHREIMRAVDCHYPLVEYYGARSAGVSPGQFAEFSGLVRAHSHTSHIPQAWGARMYVRALVVGIGYGEYCEGLRCGYDMASYVMARQAGATITEVRVVATAERGHLSSYALARQSGASHDEYVDAVEYSVSLPDYARQRALGHSHLEAITLVTPHRPAPQRIVRYPDSNHPA